jgi:Zn-dependent alcohol dehydrogenase
MKAAILREFKTPLTIEDVEQPQPDALEVLIEVEACGVCHSDLHVADGDWPQLVPITKRPLILGHEIAGRVVEKGASVKHLEAGDRVGVPWVYWTCGECDFCCEGNENLCAKAKNHRSYRRRRIRRVRQSSREPCHKNSQRTFLCRRCAAFLRGSHCISGAQARKNPTRPAFGGVRCRWPGSLGRANWGRPGGDRDSD